MSFVTGDNVMLYIYDGGQWKPVICGRSCTLNIQMEILETSITGTGIFRTYIPTAVTWDCNFEGLVFLQKVNTLALPDITARLIAGQTVLIRFQRTDQDSNVYLNEGIAIIVSVTDTGTVDSADTFSINLKGTGVLTPIFTPTPINPSGKVKRLEYTGIAGEYFFASGLINLVDIISCTVDGQERSIKITSGTPVNQEFKYTSGSGVGRIEIGQPIDNGVQVVVLYQDL